MIECSYPVKKCITVNEKFSPQIPQIFAYHGHSICGNLRNQRANIYCLALTPETTDRNRIYYPELSHKSDHASVRAFLRKCFPFRFLK
jgi:hypothetical protein